METFTGIKNFVNDPLFHKERMKSLERLDLDTIDEPILDIITHFTKLDYCFTLQSCFGHFLYDSQINPRNIQPLPLSERDIKVEYRIAYIALCIENSKQGMSLLTKLKKIPLIDNEYIQFGCADWFWERHLNSYALQVEPGRFMHRDTAIIDYSEALHIQEIKGRFFKEIRKVLGINRINTLGEDIK